MNHMYYLASTTPDGDPDVMEAKWRMLALHVQNIHDKCTHRELKGEARNRLWLIAGIFIQIKCCAKAAHFLVIIFLQKNV